MIRFRLAVLAVALASLVAVNAAPVLPLPAPFPCSTDTECEARFGAGDWFPAR